MSDDKAKLQKQMELRDKINPSPEQRAIHLWKAIYTLTPKPTFWDLVCFCTETFAIVATEYSFLKPIAAKLVSIVYTAHYQTPDPFPSSLDAERQSEGTMVESSISTVLRSEGN